MKAREVYDLTIQELRRRMIRGELKVSEVVTAFLERIEAADPHVQAYLSVLSEEALAQAREYDSGTRRIEAGRLAGIPLAIKDVICMRGTSTTLPNR